MNRLREVTWGQLALALFAVACVCGIVAAWLAPTPAWQSLLESAVIVAAGAFVVALCGI